MKTEVVNIRAEPFGRSARDVYVGRAGRGETGYYGNPVEIGRPCPECRGVHATGGDTLPCYRRYLERRLSSDCLFRRRVAQLHGKRLYCFCAPRPCHAQILAEWAARLAKRYVTVDFGAACHCRAGRHTQCEGCFVRGPCTCPACDLETGRSWREYDEAYGSGDVEAAAEVAARVWRTVVRRSRVSR